MLYHMCQRASSLFDLSQMQIDKIITTTPSVVSTVHVITFRDSRNEADDVYAPYKSKPKSCGVGGEWDGNTKAMYCIDLERIFLNSYDTS